VLDEEVAYDKMRFIRNTRTRLYSSWWLLVFLCFILPS